MPSQWNIFEPFAGSGNFAVCCINQDKTFIGSEIDKSIYDYCLNNITSQRRTLNLLTIKSNTMKQLFLFASMMLSVTAYSQWEIGNYVDDFGEETGEMFAHQTAMGVFSNSATTKSKCAYFLEHNKTDNIFAVTIYPYARKSKETWYDDTFQDVK